MMYSSLVRWSQVGLVLMASQVATAAMAAAPRDNVLQSFLPQTSVDTTLSTNEVLIAQVIPDDTLGNEGSLVVGDGVTDLIEGGAARGENLFHSFEEFNVNTGQQVYFANPIGIETILSRVTGTNLSDIDGVLGVNGAANLFLLNPNGITFGPNAVLDLSGSFTASTADTVDFEDGGVFSAVTPEGGQFLTVSVPLGVQFAQQPQGDIANDGELTVGTGQFLTLFGDTVVNNGSLTASSGTVEVLGSQVSLIGDQSTIDVSGLQGGQVLIDAENIDLSSGLIDISGTETGGELTVYANKELNLGIAVDAGGGGHALFDPPTLTVNAPEANTLVTTLADGDATISASETININAVIDSSIQTNSNILTLEDENDDGVLEINLNAPILLGTNQGLLGDGSTVNVNVTNPSIVQNGIDVTLTGGTVNLTAGAYREGRTVIIDRDVTLQGQAAGNTILDGSNSHSVLQVNNGNVNINNLTIANGLAQGGNAERGGGGGLGAGGGIFIDNGDVTINGVIFSGNQAIGGNATGIAGAGSGGATAAQTRTAISGPGGDGGDGGGLNGSVGGGGGGGAPGATVKNSFVDGNAGTSGTSLEPNSAIFGNGGGGGGGGSGNVASGAVDNKNDQANAVASGGAGGNGGIGGFGGGGGGGGGSGGGAQNLLNPGRRGQPGKGGTGDGVFAGTGFAGTGNTGSQGSNAGEFNNGTGGQGGQGGGGAGLGGAIFIRNGNLTLSNSTLQNNSAQGGIGANPGTGAGGAIFVYSESPNITEVNISNITFSNNQAEEGSAIHNFLGNTSLNNSTIVNDISLVNSIPGEPINNDAFEIKDDQGSVQQVLEGQLNIQNSIISMTTGNVPSAITPSNLEGTIIENNNIISNNIGGNIITNTLGNNGGSTPTYALLPGNNPAIDQAGPGSTTADQREAEAAGERDIGAYEARFVLTPTSGSAQSTNFEEVFATPLTVTVTDELSGNPITLGTLTFQAPPQNQASAILSSTSAPLDAASEASITAIANGILGNYQITADTPGSVGPANFDLTNTLDNASIFVDTLSDINDGNVGTGEFSLREALDLVASGGTIGFASNIGGETIQVGPTLPTIDQNLTIEGLANRPTVITNTPAPIFDIGGSAGEVTINNLNVLGSTIWNAGNGNISLNGSNSQLGDLALTGNEITLFGNNINFGSLALTGNNVEIQENSFATDFIGNSNITGALEVTSGGPITVNGTLDVTGKTDLDAQDNDINFDNANAQFDTLNLTGNSIQLDSTLNVNDDLIIDAKGSVIQNGGSLTVGDTTNIQTSLANAGDVAISSTTNLTLSNSSIGGDLTIQVPDFFRTGRVQVAGDARVDSGDPINTVPIDLGTDVVRTGQDFAVSGNGTIDLSRLRDLPNTIQGNLTVTAAPSNNSFDPNNTFAGTPAITLDQENNQFNGEVSVITELPTTRIGEPPTIIQSDPLTVNGNVNLDAQSTGNINLNTPNNRFGDLSLTGNNVSIRENDTATLNSYQITNNLDITATDIEFGQDGSIGGDLSLQPYTNDQNISIAPNPSTDSFGLDTTETNNINAANPNSVTIGGSSGSGTLNLIFDPKNTADPFTSPLTLRSPSGAVNITSARTPNNNVAAIREVTLGLEDVTVQAEDITLSTVGGSIGLNNSSLQGTPPAGSRIVIDTALRPGQLTQLVLRGSSSIEAPLGFVDIFADGIDANAANDSDIIAGDVNIESILKQRLENIAEQDFDTPGNDIISTGFLQNTSGIDPSEGLTELPANLTDPSNRIARGCRAEDVSENENRTSGDLIVTGRGGQPLSPTDIAGNTTTLDDLGPINTQTNPAQTASVAPTTRMAEDAEEKEEKNNLDNNDLKDAQAAVRNDSGEVWLVAPGEWDSSISCSDLHQS